MVGLIGPNGAGKTTIFNLITGVYQPTSGAILFEGKSVAGKKPYLITKRGIARTFQNIRLFASMSVFDNVRAAFNMHLRHGISHALWRGKGFDAEEERIEQEARELLEIFHLGNVRDASCTSLPYGDQRRLEIVRALATKPKADPAGRTRRRHEPDGENRTHGIDPVRPGEIRDRGFAGRA